MLSLAQAGQMGVDDGGIGAFMAEVDLDLAEVFALLELMRRVTVAQSMHVRGLLHAAGCSARAGKIRHTHITMERGRHPSGRRPFFSSAIICAVCG